MDLAYLAKACNPLTTTYWVSNTIVSTIYYYYDTRLPMGCVDSCKIFESFSDALVFIQADTYNVKNVIKVLHNFLIKGTRRTNATMRYSLSCTGQTQ